MIELDKCANCGKNLSPAWRDKCGHCGVPMSVARGPKIAQPPGAPAPRSTGFAGLVERRSVRVGIVAVAVLFGAVAVIGRSALPTGGAQARVGAQTFITRSGSGMQETDKFHLEGDYRLDWTAQDTGSATVGCYHGVSVRPGHTALVNQGVAGGQSASGSTNVYGLASGDYWFDVSSGCAWTVALSPE